MTQRSMRAGAVTGLVLLVFVALVRLQPGGPDVARAVDDLAQVVAALLAAAACAVRACRSSERESNSWGWLAAACLAWGLGECLWAWYELVLRRDTPFPSPADAGFLLFPVLAAVGLLSWPSAVLHGTTRWRTLLDGALVAGALLILSWGTALGTTVRADGTGSFGYAVSLSYPLGDLVLLTLALVILSHARHARAGLGLVVLGLVLLCVADSGFAYLTAVDGYTTGSWVDAGWVGGFLLLAAAAHLHTAPGREVLRPGPARMESTPRALLPYVPAGVGLSVALAGQFGGRRDPVTLGAATVVIAALLARQLLAVLDNRALLVQVLAAQHELEHQAFHDPLTGLANRALFGERLRHGLELHRRDHRALSLLYVDLDNFKGVNDTLGHDAGDLVLQDVAVRLQAVTRTGDTVARLGGDEFAVLLEDGGNPHDVASRIVDAFHEPVPFGSAYVPIGASIGIAAVGHDEETPSMEALLQRADHAMYDAKRAGKAAAPTRGEHVPHAGARHAVAALTARVRWTVG
ncbi:GGDEF domain-containing protein [Lapillicoccus jejuensis]|nr:GGDEF domain-containing protein [Lapillicoccus jejuensis]